MLVVYYFCSMPGGVQSRALTLCKSPLYLTGRVNVYPKSSRKRCPCVRHVHEFPPVIQ
jgi:hypothetical protein